MVSGFAYSFRLTTRLPDGLGTERERGVGGTVGSEGGAGKKE